MNNKALGINRGRLALKVRHPHLLRVHGSLTTAPQASDLKNIFEPVVKEVVGLVQDQIKNCKVPIRAVLLVGGFGSSAYLKERLRESVDKSTVVMQPPNAWLAVVQGAVMKGLALSAPQLTTLKVHNRKARKHYGVLFNQAFDEKLHHHIRDQRCWDKFFMTWRIHGTMWFIHRGDSVPENKPHYRDAIFHQRVNQGVMQEATVQIYADSTSKVAPVGVDSSVELLCNLTVDLKHIPECGFKTVKGKDGGWWYELATKIEIICKCPCAILDGGVVPANADQICRRPPSTLLFITGRGSRLSPRNMFRLG